MYTKLTLSIYMRVIFHSHGTRTRIRKQLSTTYSDIFQYRQ